MEPLHKRTQVLSLLFVALMVASLVAAIGDSLLLSYIQQVVAGEPVDVATGENIDSIQQVIGIIQIFIYLACVVSFSMWFHRANKNLRAGGIIGLAYTPGQAVASFFIPFVNLVRPYQAMKEVWSGSASLSNNAGSSSWRAVSPPSHIGWWWGTFLIDGFLGNASGRLMFRAEELDEIQRAAWVTLASDLFDIPAALVALLLIRRVSALQTRGNN